eukprot:Rmarinus@m.27065
MTRSRPPTERLPHNHRFSPRFSASEPPLLLSRPPPPPPPPHPPMHPHLTINTPLSKESVCPRCLCVSRKIRTASGPRRLHFAASPESWASLTSVRSIGSATFYFACYTVPTTLSRVLTRQS